MMTPVEVMATVLALLIAVKLLVIFVNPRAWIKNVALPIYSHSTVTMCFGVLLGGASLWFLLQTLTIVDIFAVMFFLSMIMMIGVASFPKEMVSLSKKFYSDHKLVKQSWLSVSIWVVLTVWVLWELFGK